jgi:hypothetical protein
LDTTQQTTEPEAPATFGGNLPDHAPTTPEQPGNLLSLEDPEPSKPLISLATDGDRPTLNGKKADQRAAKTNFAAGPDGPGIESIANDIKSGAEDQLRQKLAQSQDLKDQELKLKVVQEKAAAGDLSPKSVAEMQSVSTFSPKNAPETIIEKLYANSFVKSMMGLGDGAQSILGQFFGKDPHYVVKSADVAADLIQRQEIVKSAIDDMEEVYKDQSWVGWGLDQAKGFIPGYKAVKLNDPKTESYLAGSVIADKVANLYAMSPEDMHKSLRAELKRLSNDNPSLAKEFAENVRHYSSSDAFLDNAFTGLDIATVIPAGAVVKGLKGVRAGMIAAEDAGKVAAAKAAQQGSGEVVQAFKAGVKANAARDTDAGEILVTVGDMERGARANATKRVDEIFGNGDPLGEGKGLRSQMNLVNNPEMIGSETSANLGATRTQRLIDDVKRNVDSAMETIQKLVKVGRLPEEALQVAFKEAEGRIKGIYTEQHDAILDVVHNLPENSLANVGSVTVRFGERDGTYFKSLQDAQQAAVQEFGLTDGAYKIKSSQEGLGFTIDVTKNIDETSQGVRGALLTTANTERPSILKVASGWARSGSDRVNPFQNENRLATVHGHAAVQGAFKDMLADIGKLSKGETKDLQRVMNANKYEIGETLQDGTALRGAYYNSLADLDQSYMAIHGHYPSEAEAKAYFTFRALNDMDWTMRNLGVFRDRARQGIETFNLFDTIPNAEGRMLPQKSRDFGGKYVDGLPWSNREDAGIVIHSKGQEPQFVRKSTLEADGARKAEIQKLLDEGYKVIQTENPVNKPFGDKFGNEKVNFILTKDHESRPLDWKQIPYRPGWHTEYPQNFFVKQPVIRRAGEEGGTTRHVYEGDTAAMGFNTQAEATKYAKAMDTARLMLKSGDNGLDDFLRKNLPFNPKSFAKLFQEDEAGNVAFSLHEPFLHAPSGQNTADVHGKLLSGAYEGFEDNVRSSYNLFQNTDKKFLGRRDNPLWTVEEKGSELNPVYNLKNAPEIDPMQSVSRAMANVLRSRFFTDYKTQAIDTWVQQFGHLLDVPKELLEANPTYYVHNTPLKKTAANALEWRAAADSRAALTNLIGTKGPLAQTVDGITMRLMDGVYNKLGQGTSDYLAPRLLAAEKDPTRLMRGVAFQFNIGLFNPVQLVQNMMTMTHTIALSPVHGAVSSMMMPLFRAAYINEGGLERAAQIAQKMGYGKAEHFKEAFEELKRSGKMVVEGEHSWKDDIGEPKLFKGKAGQVLDAGLFFFKEGEKWSRITGYATAYREFRTANPTKLITEADRRALIARSDDLTVNMTRASNASWQQGIMAIPSQFISYNTRLAEQMLSSRLSVVDKARAVGVYSALYGLPVGLGGSFGVGALAGGQYPFWESIRQYAVDNNLPMSDTTSQLLDGGLVDLLASAVTGERTDLSSKVGPGGGQVLKNILSGDKNFLDIVFGASGSKSAAIAQSFGPVTNYLMNPFREDNEQFPLTAEDILDVLRNIKSVDVGVKLWTGLTTGKLLAKDKSLMMNINGTQAIMEALTGAVPRELSDSRMRTEMTIARKDAVKAALQSVAADWNSLINAAQKGDDVMAAMYQRRISARLTLADLTPSERSQAFAQNYSTNVQRIDQIRQDFVYKNAPGSKAQVRQDNENAMREKKATQ